MLNANNERELAYVVRIGWVKPIERLLFSNTSFCIFCRVEFGPIELACSGYYCTVLLQSTRNQV